MEMYFKINADENCGQDTTSKVRNFMVEENDVPFGFDIVTNQFRPSPFELYKSECGTNIYEVQTEISEGSQELSTSVYGIKEFAKQERSHLSQSISTTASAGYNGPVVKAVMKVSASSDKKQTRMFESSGAAFAGGKVFNSVGVKRLAEVKIEDFDNKRGFVTLNKAFVRAIKTYRNSGYDRSVAREQIFNKYGMFILTRGIFGGYLQLRSTMTESSISSRFESSEESRQCFEESVSAEASVFGFSGGGSVSGGECKEEAKKAMLSSQNDYAEQSSEQVVVGGKIIDQGNFVVEPEFSTLLTSRDKYPAGDKGIELRLLSDFLSPEAISPLNVMKYHIVEAEFLEIQTHLQNHLREELLELEGMVDGCGDCEVPYLVEVETEPGQTNKYTCTCYDPESQGLCSNWNTDPYPPIDDFVYLKWNGLCIMAISNGELYSRGCRGGHAQRWKFESNGLLRSHWNQQQCVGISGTGKLILQTCDDTNSQQMWGYDQDNGYLFQLKDRCKCATIVPSEREHFEISKLQLGKCSFEGEAWEWEPLCYDGIPTFSPDSGKNYCCQSTCIVDATGSPQCAGEGCDSLVTGISNCCASQIGTKVCTAPGDTGCYTTEDVGFKSFEGAILQQFVSKQLLP